MNLRYWLQVTGLCVIAGVCGSSIPIEATELNPDPFLSGIGQGLSIAEGGVGLELLGGGVELIDIDVPGPVIAAGLIWGGRDFECGSCDVASSPYGDQEIVFDGIPIEGALLDADLLIHPVTLETALNVAYFADVTALVAAKPAGSQTYTIADGNPASDLSVLNGAGLFVLYEDPGESGWFRVIVLDGVDYAYGPDGFQTLPETFSYSPAAVDRAAQLLIYVGDAEDVREDLLLVSGNPPLVDHHMGLDGPSWDTCVFDIIVPAGADETTIQLISPETGLNPDSLLWTLGALRLPVDAPSGTGTGTPGYWANHIEAWPVDEITIGGVTYPKEVAAPLLLVPVRGDKRRTIFSSLAAAKLNVLNGTDDSCIADTITAADAWFVTWSGSRVTGDSAAWEIGEPLHQQLDDYNNGRLCAPHRDSLESVGSGSEVGALSLSSFDPSDALLGTDGIARKNKSKKNR